MMIVVKRGHHFVLYSSMLLGLGLGPLLVIACGQGGNGAGSSPSASDAAAGGAGGKKSTRADAGATSTDGEVSDDKLSADADSDSDGVADADDCAPDDSKLWQELDYQFQDQDGDGYQAASDGTICSGAMLPNSYAETYDGIVDCDDDDPAQHTNLIQYRDNDGDGYGRSASTSACGDGETFLDGYVGVDGDCDDDDGELWDTGEVHYRDEDQDGVGREGPSWFCDGAVPDDYVLLDGDLFPEDATRQNWGEATAALVPDCNCVDDVPPNGLAESLPVTDAQGNRYEIDATDRVTKIDSDGVELWRAAESHPVQSAFLVGEDVYLSWKESITGRDAIWIEKLTALDGLSQGMQHFSARDDASLIIGDIASTPNGDALITGYFVEKISTETLAGKFEAYECGAFGVICEDEAVAQRDMFVARFDSEMRGLWFEMIGGSYGHQGHSIELSDSGAITVGGCFGVEVTLPEGTTYVAPDDIGACFQLEF